MALVTMPFTKLLDSQRLGVLLPFFYNFFVMQGMGLLDTMPAYYVLR